MPIFPHKQEFDDNKKLTNNSTKDDLGKYSRSSNPNLTNQYGNNNTSSANDNAPLLMSSL